MKSRAALACALTLVALPGLLLAQGSLTPPGAPAPTMKSLQEIWNKIAGIESTVSTQQARIAVLQAQNNALQKQASLMLLNAGVSLPWNISTVDDTEDVGYFASLAFSTVDSTGFVGTYASLAFGPDGQPAIAYYDLTNTKLAFARMGLFIPTP
ncbi:MAG: hypothetical protein WCI17_02695 [bacterium]